MEMVETLLERETTEILSITVVVASLENRVAMFAGIKDPRLLVRQITEVDWPEDDWESAAREGRDVWAGLRAAVSIQKGRR